MGGTAAETARLSRVAFDHVHTELSEHVLSLPAAVDDFVETHIREANLYRLEVGGQPAGLAAIHGGSLITAFIVRPKFLRLGQKLYRRVRRMQHVQAAMVTTCDELFLSHALDDHKRLALQAYLFALRSSSEQASLRNGFQLRPASPDDISLIRQEAGDFFDPIEQRLERGELFVTERGGEPVGYGITDESELIPGVASIGMFTIERFRGEGVGTATIALQIERCLERGLRPVAGCWYYNHGSKRTLERAGLFTQTRILRIEY